MRNVARNTFTGGLVMDSAPDNTSSEVLTNALNATLITNNGDEMLLLQDMGNIRINRAYLPEGYIPLGSIEYGGVIYIASVNPIDGMCLMGSFPSPDFDNEVGSEGRNIIENIDLPNFKNPSRFYKFNNDLKLSPGDKFKIWCTSVDESLPFEFYISSIDDKGKITHLFEFGLHIETNPKETSITDKTGVDYTRTKFSVDGYIDYIAKTSGVIGIHAVLPVISTFSAEGELVQTADDKVKFRIKATPSLEKYSSHTNNNLRVPEKDTYICLSFYVSTTKLEEAITKENFKSNGLKATSEFYETDEEEISVTDVHTFYVYPIYYEKIVDYTKVIELKYSPSDATKSYTNLTKWRYLVNDGYIILNYGFESYKSFGSKCLKLRITLYSHDKDPLVYTSPRTNLNGDFLESLLMDIPVDYFDAPKGEEKPKSEEEPKGEETTKDPKDKSTEEISKAYMLPSKDVYAAEISVFDINSKNEEVLKLTEYRWIHTSELMNLFYYDYSDFADITEIKFNYAPATQFLIKYENMSSSEKFDNNKGDIIATGDIKILAVSAVGLEENFDIFSINKGESIDIFYGNSIPELEVTDSENTNKGGSTIEHPKFENVNEFTKDGTNDELILKLKGESVSDDSITYLKESGSVETTENVIKGSAYTAYNDSYNVPELVDLQFKFHNNYSYEIITKSGYAYLLRNYTDDELFYNLGLKTVGDSCIFSKVLYIGLELENAHDLNSRLLNYCFTDNAKDSDAEFRTKQDVSSSSITKIYYPNKMNSAGNNPDWKSKIDVPMFLVFFKWPYGKDSNDDWRAMQFGILSESETNRNYINDGDYDHKAISKYAEFREILYVNSEDTLCTIGIKDATNTIHFLFLPFLFSTHLEVSAGIKAYFKSLYFLSDLQVELKDSMQEKTNLNYIIPHKKIIKFYVVTKINESDSILSISDKGSVNVYLNEILSKIFPNATDKSKELLPIPKFVIDLDVRTYPIELLVNSIEPSISDTNSTKIVDENGNEVVQNNIKHNTLYYKSYDGIYQTWDKTIGAKIETCPEYNRISGEKGSYLSKSKSSPNYIRFSDIFIKDGFIKFNSNEDTMLKLATVHNYDNKNALVYFDGLEKGYIRWAPRYYNYS